MTAQWWLDERQPGKRSGVAAHVVNLCWNGLSDLETGPKLGSQQLADANPDDKEEA